MKKELIEKFINNKNLNFSEIKDLINFLRLGASPRIYSGVVDDKYFYELFKIEENGLN